MVAPVPQRAPAAAPPRRASRSTSAGSASRWRSGGPPSILARSTRRLPARCRRRLLLRRAPGPRRTVGGSASRIPPAASDPWPSWRCATTGAPPPPPGCAGGVPATRTAHHLIDPATGRPGGEGLAAVTVVAPDTDRRRGRHQGPVPPAGPTSIAGAAERNGVAALWVTTDGGRARRARHGAPRRLVGADDAAHHGRRPHGTAPGSLPPLRCPNSTPSTSVRDGHRGRRVPGADRAGPLRAGRARPRRPRPSPAAPALDRRVDLAGRPGCWPACWSRRSSSGGSPAPRASRCSTTGCCPGSSGAASAWPPTSP